MPRSLQRTNKPPVALFLTLALALALLVAGCRMTPPANPLPRAPFEFHQDSFAFANGLLWEYGMDTNGVWRSRAREPRPDYTHHCFVVARSAKQFYLAARFLPQAPRLADQEYRARIRAVVATSARKPLPESQRIQFPGFASLRDFSQMHADLLKEECGSFWQSYLQRGHWRMVFPFSRSGQERAAEELLDSLRSGGPAVVHATAFPSLRINHALLLYHAEANPRSIVFDVYDPNSPEQPTLLEFDRVSRSFTFPANTYFPGGPLDIYEVYRSACY